ncbi:MAG: aldo/keto reductase [Steroidobacteraceae bacterium]
MSESDRFSTTRRDAVKLGLYTGLATLAPAGISSVLAADSKLPLITKAIPSTGEKLPPVGVGTNSFTDANLASLQAMIKRMNELGGSVIDTAASYGESEATIGKLLDNLKLRDKFFLSTKLTAGGGMGMGMGAAPAGGAAPQGAGGPPGGAPPAGGAPGGGPGGGMGGMTMDNVSGEKSFERSLERLKTNKLDLLMVHNMSGIDEIMPKLQEWKKAGKIRYLGMTTSNTSQHAQMVEYMKKYPVDFVQVNYSIESREAEQTVLPLALERKIGVMVNVPFGGRGGRTLLSADGRELPKWAADINCSNWSQFLLKFVISHPAVTVAIPGSTKIEHMEANQAAARGVLPDAAMRKRMQDFWDAKA